MKAGKKAAKKLERRQAEYDKSNTTDKGFRRPGSQNRKRGL